MKNRHLYFVLFLLVSLKANARVLDEVKNCFGRLARTNRTSPATASRASNRARLAVNELENRLTPIAPYSPYGVSADLFEPTSVAISYSEDYGDPDDASDDPLGTLVYVGGTLVDDVPAGTGFAYAYDLPESSSVEVALYSYNDDGVSGGTSVYVNTGSYVTIPDAPSGIYAIASSTDATVYWSRVSNADSYEVYVNGTTFTTFSNSIYLNNLAPDSAYTVYVTAENSAGQGSPSGLYTFYTEPPPIPVPTQPVLTASNVTTSALTVTVSGGEGADYFELEQRDAGGAFQHVAELTFDSPSYTASGLPEFTPVEFKVTAINDGYTIASFYTFRTDYTRFLNTTQSPHVIVAAAPGSGSLVQIFNSDTRAVVGRIEAFPGYNGPVYVATGDYNGDRVVDIVVGAGAGGGPRVRVFDGKTGQVVTDLQAYEASFRGGVQVALGDVNGDGFDDLITGTGEGGGPRVRVLDLRNGNSVLADFFAYEDTFRGGVQVSAGKIDASGKAAIYTGTGIGGGPRVRVIQIVNGQPKVVADFFAYEPTVRGGVFVAAGDLNGDGIADVIAGTGVGGGPRVVGRSVANPDVNLTNFFAADQGKRSGVVAAYTVVGGKPAIVTAQGKGGPPEVSVFSVDGDPLFDLNLGLTGLNGVYVGGN